MRSFFLLIAASPLLPAPNQTIWAVLTPEKQRGLDRGWDWIGKTPISKTGLVEFEQCPSKIMKNITIASSTTTAMCTV